MVALFCASRRFESLPISTVIVKDSLAQIVPEEADMADAPDADGILVTVRRSKTNQDGETNDVRRFAYHGNHPFSRGSRILSPQACAVAASACLEKSPPEPTPLYSTLDYHPHGPRRPEQPHI